MKTTSEKIEGTNGASLSLALPITTQTLFNVSLPSQLNFTAIVEDLGLPRVFQPNFIIADKDSIPPWCTKILKEKGYGKEAKVAHETGLLYNRNPKAASSTMAGIIERISKRVAARFFNETDPESHCASFFDHTSKSHMAGKIFGTRDRKKSFLLSTVRDPAKRGISRAFFQISRVGGRNFGRGGFQVSYLALNVPNQFSAWDSDNPNQILRPDSVHVTVKNILDDYDFIMPAERFDEALVTLQLLLGLRTTDMLYYSSKSSGSAFIYSHKKDRCHPLRKPFVSNEVAKHLSSDEWFAKEYGDYLLVEAVNQSLDLTITALGREKFVRALRNFQRVRAQANEQCADSVYYPCSNDGTPQLQKSNQNCLKNDIGCGYPCIDNFSAKVDSHNQENVREEQSSTSRE
ncbi:hypothetical protein ACHAWF_003216 [Thalassiosira exigua]